MPSSTPKQERTMRAAAHDTAFALRMGIPPKLAREFMKADKGKAKPKPGRALKGKGK